MTREAIFEASVGYFLSPIARLLDDESVTEIMVNRFDRVYIERAGQLQERLDLVQSGKPQPVKYSSAKH